MKRIYTFGSGQPYSRGYVVVWGRDGEQCRAAMNRAYGNRWSMEYRDESELHPDDCILRTVIGNPDEEAAS